ncbi:MAG: tetratricopeptide repeat protein [Caldilineaceae bacterium]
MADNTSDPDAQPLDSLIKTLIACPQEDLFAWIQKHQQAISVSFLQRLKDNHVTASHILADPHLTGRLTQYALTLAGVIAAREPLALALAQWMRGMWANFNDMAEAVIWYRSAMPAFEAINDQLSVARLLANLVSVLAAVGKNQEAEECYHKAYPFFLTYSAQDPKYLIYLEQNFGWLLHTWGRYEEALAVHNRTLSLANTHQLQISIAEIQVNLALTLAKLGRLAEVEALLQHDREIARQAGEVVTVARIEMNLGELYSTQGRPVQALRFFQLAAAGTVAMEQGFILARQANLLQRLGAMPAALHQYESALESIKQYELKPFIAETQCNIAACLRLIGNRNGLKRATRQLEQAEEIWRSLGNELRLVQIQFEHISLALAKNDYTHAFALLENFPESSSNPHVWAEYRFLRAETSRLARGGGVDSFHRSDHQCIKDDYLHVIDFATEQGLRWLQRSALSGLGKLYLEYNWQKAKTYLEEAAAIDDQIRQMLTIEELKATFHEQANDLYDDLIRSSWQQQDFEPMLLYAWRAKAAAFLELAQNVGSASVYTAEQQTEIGLLRQQIAALRWSLAKEASGNLLSDSYEQTNPELASLTTRLLDVRRQAIQQQAQNIILNADSVDNVIATMETEILLEYVRCGDDIYGICATSAGIHAALHLTDATTIAEVSGHLALSFRSGREPTALSDNSPFDKLLSESLTYLHQCYQLLVSPFASILQAFTVGSKLFIAR